VQAELQKPEPGSSGAEAAAPESVPRSWLEGGIAILDPAGKTAEINEALCNWLESSAPDLVGRSFWEILTAVCPEWKSVLHRMLTRPTAFSRLELELPGSGLRRTQWFVMEAAHAAQGWFIRLNSTLPPLSELGEAAWDEYLQNDSARREMYMRLLRAEARLEALTRRWPCVVFSQRPDFTVQFASPNIEELTGVPADQWASRPGRFWELVHEADAGGLEQQCRRAAQTGKAVTNTYRIRHALTGRVAYILEARQPTMSQTGLLLGYEVVWLDVTRQTIAERRLSAAAWKETLAVLTLGMAHDFTNIIAGIHSLSESYLEQTTPGHPFRDGLALIKKSSLQASQLVQRMTALHLGQTGERNFHDLNEITSDMVELIRKTLPRRIQIDLELASCRLPVHLDAVEFRQVGINLLLNAVDAMPKGGLLTVSTSHHATLPPLENVKGVVPTPPCACITIEDTGCGIKQRHLGSIFDPFFTTKAKGSGLGLYNARLAIEKQQGAISVKSTEGVGTTFQIWLPDADLAAPPSDRATRNGAGTHRSLLLLGQGGEMVGQSAELLRLHNFHVVIAEATDSLRDFLQTSDYQFVAAVLFAESNDPGLRSLLDEVRHQNKSIKVALRLAGCDQDDLETEFLSQIDQVLSSDLSDGEFISRINQLCAPLP
jgi:signal transduction histidine kinase